MSRKAEFLSTIKPILDKKEAKQDAIELARELSDVLGEIDIGADGSGFNELKEIFNAQLVEMGKQPIVFSENTLKGITAQFANAVSDGIKAGVAEGGNAIESGIMSQLDALNKRKNALQTEAESIIKKYEKLEHYSEMSSLDVDEDIKPLKFDGGDIDEQALSLMEGFTAAEDALSSLEKGTQEYEQALIKAVEAGEKLFQMRLTLEKNKGSVRDSYILEDYKLTNLSDITSDIFDTAESYFTKKLRTWDFRGESKKIAGELEEIDKQIDDLQKNNADIFQHEQAKRALKTLQEVEEAYARISTKKGAIKKVPAQNLQIALGQEEETRTLTQLRNDYNKVKDTGNWEDAYTAIARFVNKFESELQAGNISQDRLPEYTKLYDQFTPIIGSVRSTLDSLTNYAKGIVSAPTGAGSNYVPQQTVKDAQKKADANDTSADAAEREANALGAQGAALHENLELLREFDGSKERSVWYDSKTGRYSEIKTGDDHAVTTSMDEVRRMSQSFDTGVHSHSYNVAAPSILGKDNDFDTWIKAIDYIKQRAIIAREEILSFDFSSLTKDDLQNIAAQYKEIATSIMQDVDQIIANGKIGEEFGTLHNLEEALQVRLREALEQIMQQFPGVMSSNKISLGGGRNILTSKQKADDATRNIQTHNDADTRRNELSKQLDSYDGDVLDSQTADEYLAKRKEIFELLQKENLLTDEIKDKYDLINNRLEARADLLREAESYYDDVDDLLTGQRVDSIDSAEQYRKDHIQPFDNIIDKMRGSGFFSESEIEDNFIAISNAMEQRARDIAAKGVFDELDKNFIDPNTINDAKRLNDILTERNTLLNSVDDISLIDYDHNAYADALKHNQLIEDRIALLQKENDIEKKDSVPDGASSAEVDNLRKQLDEARKAAMDAGAWAEDERNKRCIAEEAYADLHDDLYDAQKQAREAEAEVARLQQELSERPTGSSTSTKPESDANPSLDAKALVTIEELKGVLESITFNVKDASTTDNKIEQGPWALEQTLNTTIKNVLDQIQTNTLKISDPDAQQIDASKIAEVLSHMGPQVADVGNVLATEGTLSAIKTAVESINNKTVKGTRVGTGAGYKSTTMSDYTGSPFFGEKLETRKMELEKFVQQLMNRNRNTESTRKNVQILKDNLDKVSSGEQLSVWDQKFRQLKISEGIYDLQHKSDKESIETYKNLISYAKEYYSIVEKHEKAKENTQRKAILAQQKQDAETFMSNGGLNLDTLELGDEAYNKKLSDLRTKHKRNLEVIRADKSDTTNSQQIKKESDALETLLGLYKEYGKFDAKWNYSDGKNEAIEQERQMLDVYKKIQAQKASMGITDDDSRYDDQINKAWEQGFKEIENAKREARAKANDKSEVQRIKDEIKNVEKYVKELGSLEAELEFSTGDNETAELKRQIEQRQRYINLKKEELQIDERSLLVQKTAAHQKKYNSLALKESRAQDKADTSNSKKKNSEIQAEQAAKEAAIVQKLVGWYKELGQAKARQNKALFSDEQVTQAYAEYAQIRKLINTERAKLSFVNQDTDMRFKNAKAEGYRLTTTNAERAAAGKATSQRMREETKAENDTLREQKQVVKELIDLYKQLGQAEAKRDMTSQNGAEARIADKEVQNINDQIAAKRKLIKVDKALDNQFAASWMSGIESETKNPIRDLGKEYEKLGKLRAEVEKTPNGEYLEFLNKQLAAQQELVTVESRRLEISDDLRDSYNQQADKAYDDKAAELDRKAAERRDKEQSARQAELFRKHIQQSKKLAKLGQTESALNKANKVVDDATSISGWSNEQTAKLNAYSIALENLKKKYAEINNQDGAVTEEQQRELITQTSNVNKLTKEIGELIAEYNRLSGENVEILGVNTLGNTASLKEKQQQLTDMVMEYTKGQAVIKKFNATTGELTYELPTGKHEVTEFTAALRQLDNQLVTAAGDVKHLETPLEKLKRKMSEILTYFGGSSLIYEFFGQFRQGVQYVRDIDSALTELKKVTDETEETYDRFLDTASKTANKVGSTITNIVNSTADWARLGFNMEEAAQLAESTSVLLNVSEFSSIEDATGALTSTMQAFGYVAEDSMHVVDVLNEVGNNFAISSDGIATALQDSASALMAANNSYEEAVALIAAANRVVQDPNSVGAALRTISLRLRGTSVKELENAGEDTTGVITSKSKLRGQIKTLSGVDILTDTGAYKSTYEILLEISRVWKKMSDIDQAALLEILAGKNRANTAMAILSNTTDLEEAYVQALKSEGSAYAENEKYLDSIQGKIDKFNNAVQTMWSNALDDEVVKKFVSLGTIIIQTIDKIGAIKTALAALAVGAMIKNKTGPVGLLATIIELAAETSDKIRGVGAYLTTLASSTNPVAKAISDVVAAQTALQASNLAAQYNEGALTQAQLVRKATTLGLTQSVTTLNAAQMINALQTATVGDEQRNAIVQALGLTTATKALTATEVEQALITAGVSKENIAATMSALGLTTANKGLAASFKALMIAIKPLLIIGAIVAGVALLAKGIDAAITTTEELSEELSTLKTELTDIQTELKTVNQELQTTQDRINELLSKDKLSFTEEEELQQLQKTNDELQRQADLLALKEKQKKQDTADKFVEKMKSDIEDDDEHTWFTDEDNWWDKGKVYGSETEYLNHQLVLYEDYQKQKAEIEQDIIDAGGEDTKEGKKLAKEKEKIDKNIKEIQDYINGKTDEWAQDANGLDYGINTETDKWLDYIADIEDKWAIISGGDNAKSNAIKRIFNQEEFADASEEIDGLIKQLESGVDSSSIEKQIEGVISGNEDLKNKLFELGITTDEAARSFTRLGEAAAGAIEEESKLTDSISKISALEDAFNSLGSAMKEFKEEGTASADTLENLNDTFGTLDGFEDLYKVLATGEGDVEAAITRVANAYIAKADILSDVTDDELQIMVARLESLGVINAQEVLMHRQTLQQELNEKLQGYNIDLSTYATVEQAKEAIAKMATGNVCSAVVEMEAELATQYGINLSDFASTEEAKVKAAKKAALEIAKANKEAAVSAAISDETLNERQVAKKVAQIEGEYRKTVSSINAIDSNIKQVVTGVTDTLNNYYSKPFKFDLSGNKIGIGRDFDEDIDTKKDKDADNAEDKAKEEFDQLRKKYENKISHLENQQTYLENEISKLEAEDEQVGKAAYEEQIRLEKEKIKLYEQERAALLDKMKDIPKESELWYEYAEAIWETEHAIQESTLAVIDFEKQIAELYVDVFGKIEDAYNSQQELYDKRTDFIRNQIEYAELTNKDIPASAFVDLMDIQDEAYHAKLAEIASLENTINLGVNEEGVKLTNDQLADMVLRLQDVKLEAQEILNEVESIRNELKELYIEAFNKTTEAYDALGSLYDDRASYVEGDIELQQLRNQPVYTGSYDYLIENETNSLNANLSKLNAQRQDLEEAMSNGVKKGSEEWIEMEAEIRATEKAIQDNYIALEQYNEELKNLYSEAFNKVRDSFSDVTDVYDDQQAFIESYIDYLKTLGVKVPAEMYERLGEVELEKQQANIQKLADMKEALAKMESEGYTPEDEEWVQAKADIRAVEKAIWDSEVAMAEFNKAIRDMETEKFEEFIKRIGDMVNELDRIYDLLSKEDVATEDGAWTEEGITSLGLLYQKMEISKKQIADYQEAIEKLNEEYKSGAISEQEYNDRLVELKNSQWDSIDAYEEAKDAIIDVNEARIDMIEKGIDKEIEAYQELIDLKKDELDAERDLYEFRKNIKNQTKDIAALERRIAAMSGSTDAATIAERTKLEAQLREARESLDDTYYTHAMDSQSTALDDENESYVKSKEDYVEMLREALEDVEAIVANTMSQVLINADTVLGTLNSVSGEYGITLSESLTSPWIIAAQKAEEFKNSALMQEYEFAIQNGIFTGEITANFSDLFDNTTLMASDFQTNVYTVMDAIKLHVETSTSDMTIDLQIPFETAMKYATETFSPQTMNALQDVANKATGLVYQEETAIKQPWEKGDEAANTFKTDAEDVLQTVADKAAEYSPTTADLLKSPPQEGSKAWDLFGDNVESIFTNLITKANEAATKIGDKMDDIIADTQRAADEIANVGASPTTGDGGGGGNGGDNSSSGGGVKKNLPSLPTQTTYEEKPNTAIKSLQTILNTTFKSGIEADGFWGPKTEAALRVAQNTMKRTLGNWVSVNGKYDNDTKSAMVSYINHQINNGRGLDTSIMRANLKKLPNVSAVGHYAKGTLGTDNDQWAITDEIGDELVLIPGKGGNLQYMRKGTAVIPADISANLMEWGKLNPNMDMSGAVQGINLMTNVISKPELNLSFDALVKAEHITEETLPAVKKLVTEELDKFTRNLNYSLRRVGAK